MKKNSIIFAALAVTMCFTSCAAQNVPDNTAVAQMTVAHATAPVVTTSTSAAATTTEAPVSKQVKLEIDCKVSSMGDPIEIPKFTEADNAAVSDLNARIDKELTSVVDNLEPERYAYIQAFPIENKRYTEVVCHYYTYPHYGEDGEMTSYVYDNENNSEVTLADAYKLAQANESSLADTISSKAYDCLKAESDNVTVNDTEIVSFFICPDDTVTFIAYVDTEYQGGDSWKRIMTYNPYSDTLYTVAENYIDEDMVSQSYAGLHLFRDKAKSAGGGLITGILNCENMSRDEVIAKVNEAEQLMTKNNIISKDGEFYCYTSSYDGHNLICVNISASDGNDVDYSSLSYDYTDEKWIANISYDGYITSEDIDIN